MPSVKSSGPLVIIGGAEDKKDQCEILREFIHLAGGDAARIVVMTTATQLPVEVGQEYLQVFRSLMNNPRAESVRVVHVESRAEANREEAVQTLKEATGVFFTGGDQYRITSLIGGTKLDTVLHRIHEEGVVLGGTSAGASMMSSTMIIEGKADHKPRLGMVQLGPGLEFLPGVIIDQHFGERGRIHRLLSAIAQFPHQLGIGIDENTALKVEGSEFSVLGAGAVTIVDAGGITSSNVLDVEQDDYLALCNVKLHILPHGYSFDLRGRTPFLKNSHNENKI